MKLVKFIFLSSISKVSMDYQVLVGNNEIEDNKILLEIFHNGVRRDIAEIESLKRLATEIVFKYLTKQPFHVFYFRFKGISSG